MALQYSVPVNNGRLDSIEVTLGAGALLKIYSGAVPANCATAASGTLLANITLPADYLSAAASGVKSKVGTWSGTGAAAGTAGYFRITDSTGAAVGLQGTATASGGGGDMTLDNTSIAASQQITVNSFSITAANT